MTTTAVAADHLTPLGFAEALELAEEENRRLSAVVHGISPDQWGLPTDCTAWTVRDLAGHLLGSLDANCGLLRSARAWHRAGRAARRNGTRQIDEATAAEVAAEFDRLPARNIPDDAASPRRSGARQLTSKASVQAGAGARPDKTRQNSMASCSMDVPPSWDW